MNFQRRREFAAAITLAIFLAFIALVAPSFYSISNLRDVALANLPVLLIASGMTLVVVVAQIDISVGSMFAICGVCGGLFVKHGLAPGLLPVAGIVLGALLGAGNGALISFVRAPSIVVTLATMVAWRQALNWATGGAWVEGLPADFQWFGLGQSGGELLLFVITGCVFASLYWASGHIAAFRTVYATGSDAEAARLAGINPQAVVFSVFVLLGALTGLAASLNAVRFSDVPANSGIGLELQAIAAVVVGGTPITGGRGGLIGTLIGVALLGSIGPALTFLGFSPYWGNAIQGGIILVAVFFDAVAGRSEKRFATA